MLCARLFLSPLQSQRLRAHLPLLLLSHKILPQMRPLKAASAQIALVADSCSPQVMQSNCDLGQPEPCYTVYLQHRWRPGMVWLLRDGTM